VIGKNQISTSKLSKVGQFLAKPIKFFFKKNFKIKSILSKYKLKYYKTQNFANCFQTSSISEILIKIIYHFFSNKSISKKSSNSHIHTFEHILIEY